MLSVFYSSFHGLVRHVMSRVYFGYRDRFEGWFVEYDEFDFCHDIHKEISELMDENVTYKRWKRKESVPCIMMSQ